MALTKRVGKAAALQFALHVAKNSRIQGLDRLPILARCSLGQPLPAQHISEHPAASQMAGQSRTYYKRELPSPPAIDFESAQGELR